MKAQTATHQTGISAPDMPRMEIELIPIADLKPDPRNPRIHTKKQIRQIAASIKAFGFNVPILVDGQLKIVAGHGRLAGCKELGWSEVPVMRLEHLTPEQAMAFQIADNRLTENSTWDERLLAEQLRDLSLAEIDFSLEVTGFEMGEIDFKLEGLSLQQETDEDADDKLPSVAGPAVTQLGDLWFLGPHRLYCGNALEENSYAVLMAGRKAAVIFTDPPYNVRIDGHVSGNGAVKHREFAMAAGEMNPQQFTDFLQTVFARITQHSQSGSIHFVFMDWRHLPEILAAGAEIYSELKNVCVWVKKQAGMGSLYRSQHELILVYKYGTENHQNNVQLGRFGRYRTNVWEYPGIQAMRSGEEGDLLALHPTVKPIRLVADAILDCSSRGDIALDPFLGSGTTLLAAERTGRVCYAMELDPLYVDTAILRWQQLTGEDAVHSATGKTFTRKKQINQQETRHGQ